MRAGACVEQERNARVACVMNSEMNGHRHRPQKSVVLRTPPEACVVGEHYLATALPTTHVAVMLDDAGTPQCPSEYAAGRKFRDSIAPPFPGKR